MFTEKPKRKVKEKVKNSPRWAVELATIGRSSNASLALLLEETLPQSMDLLRRYAGLSSILPATVTAWWIKLT